MPSAAQTPTQADQLACIASFHAPAPHNGNVPSQHRLPLAWVAASPSARLVAEQHHAWVVLPLARTRTSSLSSGAAVSRHNAASLEPTESNVFGPALANATTSLNLLREALDMPSDDSRGKLVASHQSKRHGKPSKVLSLLSQAADALADVNHAASPVEAREVSALDSTLAETSQPHICSPTTKRGNASTVPDRDPLEVVRGCGVHIGGATSVLVSGMHLLGGSAVRGTAMDLCTANNNAATEKLVEAPQTQHQIKRHQKQQENPVESAHPPNFLFPSTTACGGSVASLLVVPPNAAVYDVDELMALKEDRGATEDLTSASRSLVRAEAELHGDDGGAEDEAAHDPKTAASIYTVQQVHTLRRQLQDGDVAAALTTVWYRQVFVGLTEATGEVLCGVSRWWLQRPVHVHELPTLPMRRRGGVRDLKQQNEEQKSKAHPSKLAAPPLYVKYISDIGADLWLPHRFISVVRRRTVEHPWHTSVASMRWLLLLWVTLVTLLESIVHGVPEVTAPHATLHHGSDLVKSFYTLGEMFGAVGQVAALDASHTCVRGAQLVAFALGKTLGAWKRSDACSSRVDETAGLLEEDAFRALDVAGCIQLHHRNGELQSLAPLLEDFHEAALTRREKFTVAQKTAAAGEKADAAATSALAVVDVLVSLSLQDEKALPTRSATGLALALLSHHSRLTWMSGAGCDVDNAALHELGLFALLTEVVAATCATAAPPHHFSCALCALDLTSALNVSDINSLAYLPHLAQVLIPFTYITDGGIARLDGHTFPHDLHGFLNWIHADAIASLAPSVQEAVRRVMADLERFSSSFTSAEEKTALNSPDAAEKHSAVDPSQQQQHPHSAKQHTATVAQLHERFRSHLYQLDLTNCLLISNINGFVQQRRLAVLNISQTRVNKSGFLVDAGKPASSTSGKTAAGAATANPPLRLFIAEMCEHLSDLGGLSRLATLECVVVRSGSLGDDGLRALCTQHLQRLQLLDLSYCDRLHHIGCLADLPALNTLILDSTDVTPAEVKTLKHSRSLETLSLRFCTEFAVVGNDMSAFEVVVGKIPTLKHYVYEDLVGDAELRRKRS